MSRVVSAASKVIGGVLGVDSKPASRELQKDINNIKNTEPTLPEPTMPVQNMDQIRTARNLRAIRLSQRSGRSSTVLTQRFGG